MPTQRSFICVSATQKVSAIPVFLVDLQPECLKDLVVSTRLSVVCTLPRPGSEKRLRLAFPEHSFATVEAMQLRLANPGAQLPVFHKASVSMQCSILPSLGVRICCSLVLLTYTFLSA